MLLDELTFGTCREIEPGIVEAIAHEGVELTAAMIQQAEAGLLEKYCNAPYALLVNRINAYSHTMESMEAAARMKNLAATAIVTYSNTGKHAAELQLSIDPHLRAFDSRDAAMAWLRERLDST